MRQRPYTMLKFHANVDADVDVEAKCKRTLSKHVEVCNWSPHSVNAWKVSISPWICRSNFWYHWNHIKQKLASAIYVMSFQTWKLYHIDNYNDLYTWWHTMNIPFMWDIDKNCHFIPKSWWNAEVCQNREQWQNCGSHKQRLDKN